MSVQFCTPNKLSALCFFQFSAVLFSAEKREPIGLYCRKNTKCPANVPNAKKGNRVLVKIVQDVNLNAVNRLEILNVVAKVKDVIALIVFAKRNIKDINMMVPDATNKGIRGPLHQ